MKAISQDTKRPEAPETFSGSPPAPAAQSARTKEIGGPKWPEPTRYGDWERNGRCVDF